MIAELLSYMTPTTINEMIGYEVLAIEGGD